MHYRILQAIDIEEHKDEMIVLMDMVLRDNITQNYPSNQALLYVEKIPGYISDGSAIVSGAFDENKLVGFSWAYEFSIFGERRVHIDMIGVDLAYRKQGIARKMIELQIQVIRKRGISIVEAMTTKSNVNSYNWFHFMGFEDERVKVKLELKND